MMTKTKCNILVLTSLYPADDIPKSDTPVVHYFTKEWVEQECNVEVFHFAYNMPDWAFWIVRNFPLLVSKVWGGVLRTKPVLEREYRLDGVCVKRIPLKKIKPHGAYSRRQINKTITSVINFLKAKDFQPDVIISHWCNPQLEIMAMLKERYKCPTIYVAHNKGAEIQKAYGNRTNGLLSTIDLFGFRSGPIENEFRRRFDYQGPSFRCNSGIPMMFVSNENVERKFDSINRFIYVGTLIKRKHPDVIIPAVKSAMGAAPFSISFIGEGNLGHVIRRQIRDYHLNNQVNMPGYLDRKDVNCQLRNHDIFIMVSSGETFGLVYLEAMSAGCITIASKGEGMDGIIKHGENGFLCAAGNINELTMLIREIQVMSKEKLEEISNHAIETARALTDKNVAADYLGNIVKLIKEKS